MCHPGVGDPAICCSTGAANDAFVTSIEDIAADADATLGMGHWTAADLPFDTGLARTFPLADRWFCSCLGPTFPNRRFLIAATADGLIDDAIASIIDYPRSGSWLRPSSGAALAA